MPASAANLDHPTRYYPRYSQREWNSVRFLFPCGRSELNLLLLLLNKFLKRSEKAAPLTNQTSLALLLSRWIGPACQIILEMHYEFVGGEYDYGDKVCGPSQKPFLSSPCGQARRGCPSFTPHDTCGRPRKPHAAFRPSLSVTIHDWCGSGWRLSVTDGVWCCKAPIAKEMKPGQLQPRLSAQLFSHHINRK